MTHQMLAARRTFLRGRGFSSASAICGLGGPRTYVASVRHPIDSGCMVGGFGSQSLFNLGGRERISYGGYGPGCGYDFGFAGYGNPGFGGQMGPYGPRVYDSAGSCGSFGGYLNARGDGIHGVRINERLLKPLEVGVDPQEQIVRNHEREEMKSLNTQFASFIDKVRNLELQNKVLETKWNLLQEHVIPAKKNLEPYYESFICNMKKQLECLLADREHLKNENAAIEHLVEEFKCKYEQEFKMRTNAENEFVLLKKDVDTTSLNKTELEGKVDLLRRELEFRRCVYAEELAQLDHNVLDTNILLEMDNSRDLNLDCILKNVEDWYQNVAQRSQEEANAFYENRFQELQQQRGKYSQNLQNNQQEIAELTRVIHKLQSEHDLVKKQANAFQTSICDVEQRGDCALKDARDKHIELQTAVQKAKDDLAGLLRDYHELLNTKLALDIEIATYKTLLEGEETRLYTGNPVCIDVVKPPGLENAPGFAASSAYGPLGGGHNVGYNVGYGRGYGMGSQGRFNRNYSSRSVGFGSRTAGINTAVGHTSADAEFYPERRYSSVGDPNNHAGIDGSSVGGGAEYSTGAGFSSRNVHGSDHSTVREHMSRTYPGNGPDGGYPCENYGPSGVASFGDAGWGSRVGHKAGYVDNGSATVPTIGVPGTGIPSMGVQVAGLGGFGRLPCVGMGAPGGVSFPGPVGNPAGMCFTGAVAMPIAVYPGAIGLL